MKGMIKVNTTKLVEELKKKEGVQYFEGEKKEFNISRAVYTKIMKSKLNIPLEIKNYFYLKNIRF